MGGNGTYDVCDAASIPITLTVVQSGPTITGTYSGGDVQCLIRFDRYIIPLANGPIANGAIVGDHLRLDLGTTGVHMSGTVSGNSAAGSVLFRDIVGLWQGSKQ